MNDGIIRLENIIAADYDNIAGIVVQKKGKLFMNVILTAIPQWILFT